MVGVQGGGTRLECGYVYVLRVPKDCCRKEGAPFPQARFAAVPATANTDGCWLPSALSPEVSRILSRPQLLGVGSCSRPHSQAPENTSLPDRHPEQPTSFISKTILNPIFSGENAREITRQGSLAAFSLLVGQSTTQV